MKLTPFGPTEDKERGYSSHKKIYHWLSKRGKAGRSGHRRKRCSYCGKIYPHSTKSCPVCGSKHYKLRSH